MCLDQVEEKFDLYLEHKNGNSLVYDEVRECVSRAASVGGRIYSVAADYKEWVSLAVRRSDHCWPCFFPGQSFEKTYSGVCRSRPPQRSILILSSQNTLFLPLDSNIPSLDQLPRASGCSVPYARGSAANSITISIQLIAQGLRFSTLFQLQHIAGVRPTFDRSGEVLSESRDWRRITAAPISSPPSTMTT